VRTLRSIYDFITGGSRWSLLGLLCGVGGAILFPSWNAAILTGCIALGFIASVFERIT
jgi:hypothetical protein